MRNDVAFACAQFGVSERRACKLLALDRSSYRCRDRIATWNGPDSEEW